MILWLEIVVAFLGLIVVAVLFGKYVNHGDVPTVAWSLPYFGHALYFQKNPIDFLNKCRQKYGSFFRIKLFRMTFIIVCDRAAMTYYTKQDETKFSFHGLLKDIYFGVGFSDSKVPIGLEILRKGVTIKVKDSTPSMKIEAEKLVNSIKEKSLNLPLDYDVQWEHLGRYVTGTSSRSFLNFELQEETFLAFRDFHSTLQLAMNLGNCIPINWVHFFLHGKLSKLRKTIRESMIDVIEDYQNNPTLKESFLIRTAVDTIDKETGNKYDCHQVAAILLATIFASTINSSTCMQNVLVDLAQNPEICERLRSEMVEHIENDDMDAILNSTLLTACIMETARLNPSVIGLVRKVDMDTNLGQFNLKKGELIGIANHMMMQDDGIFKKALEYNPFRFLGEDAESWSQYNIVNWSAGTHLCPGKQFAINEIKVGLAYLLHNFKLTIPVGNVQRNILTTHQFADRKVLLTFTERNRST